MTDLSTYRQPTIRVSRYTSGLPKVAIVHGTATVAEMVKLSLAECVDVVAQTRSGQAAVALSELLIPNVMASIATEWRRASLRMPVEQGTAALTTRELEVLDAMADGMSTKAVAHHLGIAVKTVENHKTRIFDKLGVRTQSEAVVVALGTPRSGR